MSTTVFSLIRHLVTALGAVLVARNVIPQEVWDAISADAIALVGAVVSIIGFFIKRERKPKAGTGAEALLLAVAFTLLTGCASFVTKQEDISYDEKGKPQRAITTYAKSRTFWDSKSALATFQASQTDKTQSAKVGGLNQESSGTNAVLMLEALSRLVGALPK